MGSNLVKNMDCILQHIPKGIDQRNLINALYSENDLVCSLAALAVGHLDIHKMEVIEQHTTLLLRKRICYDLNEKAAFTIGQICCGQQAGFPIDRLIRDLQNDSSLVRARVVTLLGSIKSSDRISAAIAALQHVLRDPKIEISQLAIKALLRLGQPALPVPIEYISTTDCIRLKYQSEQ